MVKYSSVKVLLKKCFRDIFSNIKQFLAIIFIITTSVTLFIGLEANYVEFSRRINYVFDKTNMGDIYVTSIPDFEADTDEDLLKIDEILKDKGNYEKRLYLPSFYFNDASLNGLFYNHIPEISKPYDVETIEEDNEENFFYLDETIFGLQKQLNKTYDIGDEISVSFSQSQLSSLLETLFGNDSSSINELFIDYLFKYVSSKTVRDFLYVAIKRSDESMLKDAFPSLVEKLLTNKSSNLIDFNFKITGKMKHAENVENGAFAASNFLMSSKLLFKKLLSRIEENLDVNFLKDSFEILSSKGMDKLSYSIGLKYLNTNSNDIKNLIDLTFKELNREINSADGIKLLNNLYDQIIIKVKNSNDINDIYNEIRNYYLSKEVNNLMLLSTKENLTSTMTVVNDLKQSQALAITLPIIFFVVAILVVLTTITQLLLKERTQIGTMKALGYSKNSILLYYILMINIIALFGVLLGFIIGPILIPQIMNIKYNILYCLPAIGYSFPFVAGILIVSAVIILISLLTYSLIKHELNLTPVQSMRPSSPAFKMKKHNKFIKNTSLMMALRNIRVYFNKSIMVIVGVMGCTGLLICGFGIEDTINYGLDVDLSNVVNGDINLTYSLNTPFDENKDILLTYSNIEDVSEYGVGKCNVIEGDNAITINYYYISKSSELFSFDNGKEWKEGEVGISTGASDKINKNTGDQIEFKIGSNTYKATLGLSFYSFTFKGIFIYKEDLNYSTIPQYANACTLVLKDKSIVNTTKEEILNDNNIRVETAMTKQETSDKIEGYVSSIKTMTNTVKVFAIVLAVIVLVNLAILNFNERIREIATLRVLGFNVFEIGRSLIYEIMILTVIGCTFGLFLGFPLEFMVLFTNQTELVTYGYIVYPASYAISFLLSLITAFLVNLFISRKINKVPMAESLKSIE